VNRRIIRVLGIFGLSFFSPLIGGSTASTFLNIQSTPEQLLVTALISAAIITGFSLSKEAASHNGTQKEKV